MIKVVDGFMGVPYGIMVKGMLAVLGVNRRFSPFMSHDSAGSRTLESSDAWVFELYLIP